MMQNSIDFDSKESDDDRLVVPHNGTSGRNYLVDTCSVAGIGIFLSIFFPPCGFSPGPPVFSFINAWVLLREVRFFFYLGVIKPPVYGII